MTSDTASKSSAASTAPFDVVALVTSAGGLDALSAVLRNLPPDFPAAVLVVQHLSGAGSLLVEILSRWIALPVSWIAEGDRMKAGHVLVCPPRKRLEVLPDATCSLSPLDHTGRDKPLDFVLESLADSFGARTLAVVLTGMGKDGAGGARKLKRAGGTVLVQSEDTAEHPSMPQAAIESGAADLVLPLHQIGGVITKVVFDGKLPRPQKEIDVAQALFEGPGEVPKLLREIDWAQTPLGSVSQWSVALRTALRLVLESPMPMIVMWGRDLVQLYNDSYRLLMGVKHPGGLGQSNRESWPEVWHLNEPLYQRVFAGQSVALENALYPITRHGALENAWFNLYFTPVRDDNGVVAGVFSTIIETTSQVLAARRLHSLHALATETAGAGSPREVCQRALASLESNDQDIPFALSYLLDTTSIRAHLGAAIHLEVETPVAPSTISLHGEHPVWPLEKVIQEGIPVLVEDLAARFRAFDTDPGVGSPTAALLLPLRVGDEETAIGVLILGISSRLSFDALYRGFYEVIARQISASIAEAQIRQKERERAERLAELDRLKIEFFSNISHEFRTPLMLMLAPLEALLHQRELLPNGLAQEAETASRNGHRLLSLVNSLLDFSQAEAGRLRAYFESTDLSQLTTHIASRFRSTAEQAGLQMTVNCLSLPKPVWVDREMWEKIVSNLISNALKFTFEGEIVVELHALPQHAELIVRDTGVGIPEAELPNLFRRFHRVEGTGARTYEGAGIGLALVHELVRLHHGRIRVRSKEGEGSSFTVWIPLRTRSARQEDQAGEE